MKKFEKNGARPLCLNVGFVENVGSTPTIKNENWFDENEFKRVSPLGTQHVNFLGKYIFEESRIETKDRLRELVIKV